MIVPFLTHYTGVVIIMINVCNLLLRQNRLMFFFLLSFSYLVLWFSNESNQQSKQWINIARVYKRLFLERDVL